MRRYRVAVIPGDGIGQEVTPAAMAVVDAAARRWGFTVEKKEFPWGADYYLEHGVVIPDEGMKEMAQYEAIYLGAIGAPGRVPEHILLRGSLLRIRQEYDLYINLRPVKLLPGIPGPLREPVGDVDMLCVRENSEGEYIGMGGRMKRGTPDEVAIQTTIFTRNRPDHFDGAGVHNWLQQLFVLVAIVTVVEDDVVSRQPQMAGQRAAAVAGADDRKSCHRRCPTLSTNFLVVS